MDLIWFVATMVVAAVILTLIAVTLYGAFMFVSYYVMCVLTAVSKMFETDVKTTAKGFVVFTAILTVLSFIVAIFFVGLPT